MRSEGLSKFESSGRLRRGRETRVGVFVLHDGRLVAPQQLVAEVSDDVCDAVRSQALEFIHYPLFGVGRSYESGTFLALDATGQVASIDFFDTLSSQAFMRALARAGRHSQMGRGALGQLYTGGSEAFDSDYRAFVDSAPPLTKPGPRLFLFSPHYEADVLRAISALRGAGVEAYQIFAHQGAQGLLVEIAKVMESPTVLPWAEEAAELMSESAQTADEEGGAEELISEPAPTVEPEPVIEPEPVVVWPKSAAAPEPAAASEPIQEVEEAVDRAQRYDEAWDISGWRYEKERPAKRDPSDLLYAVELRRASDEAKKAFSEEATSLLEKNRQDVGMTMYDLLLAESKRAEQRLWDMSAPKDRSATIFSERASSEASSEAVAQAAVKSDRWDSGLVPRPSAVSAPAPNPRLQRIVAQVGTVKVTWRSRRKHQALYGYLTSAGLIDIAGVGVFADPSEAAAKASGMDGVDGWSIWRVPDGRSLGDIA